MIQLTAKARERIRHVMAEQQAVAGLRLGVQGGGCSGLTYAIQFDSEVRPHDHVLEFDGARVLVDPRSLEYLKDITLDYKADLLQKSFVIHNPNANETCGCGLSFTA